MNDDTFVLQNVTKTYNGRTVLRIPELQVRRGEVFAVVGPSGAGKSTLLRLLNFLEPPTTGRIRFRETVFDARNGMPLKMRRRVSTVFQRPVLLSRSVADNVSYGLGLRGQRDASELVRSTLAKVGLESLGAQPASTLSGGEAQRVALARAMVLDLDALLLDEPTANLDPYNVGLIEGIIKSLNEEKRTTTVLVTHNVFQARRLADRVALLLEGQLVEVSAVSTFFEDPGDPRTAAFVRGDMVY